MKIIVIGGTGLIGSKTVAILRQGGHEVVAASQAAPRGLILAAITPRWLT
ncbi:MAG: NAD-dependent epimerase/dehydratase family protein, partial [Pseudolabrys sp.]